MKHTHTHTQITMYLSTLYLVHFVWLYFLEKYFKAFNRSIIGKFGGHFLHTLYTSIFPIPIVQIQTSSSKLMHSHWMSNEAAFLFNLYKCYPAPCIFLKRNYFSYYYAYVICPTLHTDYISIFIFHKHSAVFCVANSLSLAYQMQVTSVPLSSTSPWCFWVLIALKNNFAINLVYKNFYFSQILSTFSCKVYAILRKYVFQA